MSAVDMMSEKQAQFRVITWLALHYQRTLTGSDRVSKERQLNIAD